ncbi:hypothetical protein C8J55DRAFT_490803 [Lentinula edodes]|uniref:Uncharacterized protein n=1 Tax=Lentinula lateritia TaxID=40482 RepID=A0A9W9A4G9_9AGAR|nr:hypothetical protein C8J55DRAFT_490803 [Lentinula edodes]
MLAFGVAWPVGISVTKIILLLCADDVVLLSFLLGAVTKLVLHVLNVTENGAVKDLLWHHKRLRMKWTTLKMRWTISKMITDIMHETESTHDSDNNEEIPRQVLESHNLNARVKTTLIPVEQDNQQRANSINEPLNDVDSDINYFLDVNSSEDQFKKNEKTSAKQENERLRRELKELKSQMSARIRRDIAEHTHLNVLNRLLIQTRSEYSQNKLSQSAVNETFDNLSSQLRDLADRRLENMPVGFGRILDLIKTSEIDNEGSPSKKQRHS